MTPSVERVAFGQAAAAVASEAMRVLRERPGEPLPPFALQALDEAREAMGALEARDDAEAWREATARLEAAAAALAESGRGRSLAPVVFVG